MSNNNNQHKMCYFCESVYPYPSVFINNHDGLFICENSLCDYMMDKKKTIEEKQASK